MTLLATSVSPIQLPTHKYGLCLSHNAHKRHGETVELWSELEGGDARGSWISEEQRRKAIATDECWELDWYPDDPTIGRVLLAADLDELLRHARKLP